MLLALGNQPAPEALIAPGTGGPPLLVHHVARIVDLSPRMVRHLAARQELKAFRRSDTPKIWRFHRQDVVAFLVGRRGADGSRRGPR
jgi:hypothetical protein